MRAIPELPNKEASTFRSLAVLFWLGFISAARNLGGRPYRRMLSTKSLIAQMWIHALNACTRAYVLTAVDQRIPQACRSLPMPLSDLHLHRPGPTHLVERVKSRCHDQPVHTSVQSSRDDSNLPRHKLRRSTPPAGRASCQRWPSAPWLPRSGCSAAPGQTHSPSPVAPNKMLIYRRLDWGPVGLKFNSIELLRMLLMLQGPRR